MLTPNFMLRDVVGSLLAIMAFAPLLYAPGYLAAVASNIFNFRKMRFAEQSLWAVAFSFCITPIAAHLIGKSFGLSVFTACSGLVALSTVPLLLRFSGSAGWTRRDITITMCVVAGWSTLVLLLLVDFQIGHRLYYSVVMADQSYRIAFTDAVARTGVPPANPLYFAGSPAPMRYYYFWYILCATVMKLAHVSARQAFIASSVWAAMGLTVTVKLYATYFFHWTRKTAWIAIALLLVTGADLLPALGNLFLQSSVNGNSEWWSVDQIDAWPDSILWVPHHVASVLCCLIAFLLIWRQVRKEDVPRAVAVILIAGAACASAFGLSVYVAVGFALLMATWVIRVWLKDTAKRYTWLRLFSMTAFISLVFLAPFLRELVPHPVSGAVTPGTTSSHVLRFSVRPLIDSGLVTSLPIFAGWNKAHPWLLDQSVRLLLLLPGMAMEFGVFGAVLIFLLLARRRGEQQTQTDAICAARFLTSAGLVMTMFLSSSVITNNDFGYRAVMLPQFFMLLLTAAVLGGWSAEGEASVLERSAFRRRLVMGLLVLGIAGTAYWAGLLRAWLPIAAAQGSTGFSQSPEDNFQVREAFAQFDSLAPKDAVVAFRDMDLDAERKDMEVMTPTEFFQRMLVMDIGRQILNAEPKCATHFGGDRTACDEMKRATAALYAVPSPSASFARDYCGKFGVQYLLLSVRDPGWESPTGWEADINITAQEPRLKILQCIQNASQRQ